MNAAARLIYGLRHSDHISDAFISLHWLRAQERLSRGGDYRGDRGTRLPNILVGGRKGKCPPLIALLVKFLGHIFHLDKLDYCISGVSMHCFPHI